MKYFHINIHFISLLIKKKERLLSSFILKSIAFHLGNSQRDEVLDEISKPATAFSKIWDSEFRNEVTAAQVPEAVINKERGKFVIPKGNIDICSAHI